GFVLGTVGTNPLICFGMNPSTAIPGLRDPTTRRLQRYAARDGFERCMVLDGCPQGSTDPHGVHAVYTAGLRAETARHIAEFIGGRKLTLLAAWGQPIRTRPYLRDLLSDIVSITAETSCDWVSIGDLTRTHHPRHPSRGPYRPLQSFDMEAYLRRL